MVNYGGQKTITFNSYDFVQKKFYQDFKYYISSMVLLNDAKY